MLSNVMVAGRHSWHNFLNDYGDLSYYQLVLFVCLVFSGPSWYIILHEDGGDGDVDIVGGLRAFVV